MRVVLDVGADDHRGGWVDPSGAIHLHPTSPRLVALHELAHHVAGGTHDAGHGPGFAAAHLELVSAVLGDHLAAELHAAYLGAGVQIGAER